MVSNSAPEIVNVKSDVRKKKVGVDCRRRVGVSTCDSRVLFPSGECWISEITVNTRKLVKSRDPIVEYERLNFTRLPLGDRRFFYAALKLLKPHVFVQNAPPVKLHLTMEIRDRDTRQK